MSLPALILCFIPGAGFAGLVLLAILSNRGAARADAAMVRRLANLPRVTYRPQGGC